jgi:hypothetical protein
VYMAPLSVFLGLFHLLGRSDVHGDFHDQMSEQREFGWQAACDLEEMVFGESGDQVETKNKNRIMADPITR